MPIPRKNVMLAASDQSSGGTGAIDAAALDLDIGSRIRVAREQREMSLRRLAAKLDISPSGLSQIETGRSRPSVGTLYAIVSELGISLDDLFSPGGDAAAARVAAAAAPRSDYDVNASGEPISFVQRASDRKVIELDSGVAWERVNPPGETDVEFLEVTYDVGGSSSASGALVRHAGREYGLVLSGTLRGTVGSDEHDLGPGDSISFESSTPHRLENVGDEPVKAVWFVRGRGGSDGRAQWRATD